jgi:tRNA G18 (ribose-2'-O)-methylase SpoU
VDISSDKVIRASAGLSLYTNIAYMRSAGELIELLKRQNIQIVSADMQGQTPYYEADFSGDIAVVFGNEGDGVDDLLVEAADTTVFIPMSNGTESLNASVACAIIIYERVRNATKIRNDS